MTNTNFGTLSNAFDFIIDSLDDHPLEDIETLDEGSILDFADDYLFDPAELPFALEIARKFVKAIRAVS